MKEFLFKLDIIAPAASFAFALVLFAIRKRMFSFPDFILSGFVAIELILNIIAAVMQGNNISNLLVYLVSCIVLHLLFSYYFLKVLFNKQVIYIGFAVFCLGTFVILQNLHINVDFPSYLYSLSSFIIIIYSLVFLNQILDTLPAFNIFSLKEFWVITGTLTYFGSTFFIYISYKYLSVITPKQVHILWQLHNVFLCFGCLIFLKAINCKKWIPK